MDLRREASLEQQKTALAEQLWLHYFNQTLYEKGMISERERNRLKNRIDCRRCPPPKQER